MGLKKGVQSDENERWSLPDSILARLSGSSPSFSPPTPHDAKVRKRERGGGVVVKRHGFDSSEEWASSSLDSRGFLGQKPPGAPQGSVLGLFHICSL